MVLEIPGPLITKMLVDMVYPNRDVPLLCVMLAAMAMFSVALAMTSALTGYLRAFVGVGFGADLRQQLQSRLLNLDMNFYDRRDAGDLMARFDDMQDSMGGFVGLVRELSINLTQLLLFPVILFWINWKLAIISIAVLPLDGLIAAFARRHQGRFEREVAEQSAELHSQTLESINGIRTIQALGVESNFRQRIDRTIMDVGRTQVQASSFEESYVFIGRIIRTAGSLVYQYYGWIQVINGSLSLGSFLAFNAYVGYLYGPLAQLVGLIRDIEITKVHGQRFFEVFDHRPPLDGVSESQDLPESQSSVEFRDVWFRYSEGAPFALEGISLHIGPGTTTAIVGRSGAGKSTLIKLVSRFYDPQAGSVRIGGFNIADYNLKSVRMEVGFALQGASLFRGTLLENLTLGEEYSGDALSACLSVARVDEFIDDLPDGIHTDIGEMGIRLSEGQKQRLSLARVLLQNRPIAILDEPTASLDTESESYIFEALKLFCKDRTTIIVSHKLDSIEDVDQIVVLDQGRVIECGTFGDLVRQNGLFTSLVSHGHHNNR